MLNILALIFVGSALVLGAWLQGSRATQAPSEFGETHRPAFEWLAVAFIVAGALALRLFGIQFGLPSALHPDEFQKAHFAWNMMTHDTIIPDGHLHPPLLLYASWFLSRVVQALSYFPDQTMPRILLGGRLFSALCDTLSVLMVFLIGRRLTSTRTGLMAALFMAVSPLAVTNARYMKEDSPFVFFVLVSVLCALRYGESKRWRDLLLCGFAAGLSFGTKFTGLLSTSVVVSTMWLVEPQFQWIPNPKRILPTLLALLLIPIAFALTAPYIITQPQYIHAFVGGFESESRHAMNGHYGLAIDPWSQWWMYHFRHSILPGIGMLLAVFGLIGAGMALRKWEPKRLLIVGLLFLFYIAAEYAKSKPPPQPERYVLPCIPFLALLAAEACQALANLPRPNSRVLAQWSLAGFAAAFPLLHTVEYASEIRYDTRKQMADWLGDNLPPGTKILTMGGSLYLPHIPLKFRSKSMRKVLGKEDTAIAQRLKESRYDYLVISGFGDGADAEDEFSNPEIRQGLADIRSQFPVVKEMRPKYGSYGFHNPTVTIFDLKGGHGLAKKAGSSQSSS